MALSESSEEITSSIVRDVAAQGYAVVEHFLNPEIILALASHALHLKKHSVMHKATTGLNSTASSLRGDFIDWIEEDEASDIEQIYLDHMTPLQTALNQAFFLGLFELESHFAIYPPGTSYQKHLDQFIDKTERKISCILYLNQEWLVEEGGALRMYLDKSRDQPTIDILPQAGTLVVFLSSDFLHEVLPAKRERISITGWFKTRSIKNAS